MSAILDEPAVLDVQPHRIRELIDSGQHDEAWDEVQTCLGHHPDDVEIRLLKVELCLLMQREVAFVGQTLGQLRRQPAYRARITSLQEEAEKLAHSQLAEGRSRLRRDYPRDAIGYFNAASYLLSDDPSVPLAAALALLNQKSDPPDATPLPSLLDWLHNPKALVPVIKAEAIERYLNWTLQRSTPGQHTHSEASRQLLHFWIAQNQIGSALGWVAHQAAPDSLDPDLVNTVYYYAVAHALAVAACLLRQERFSAARALLRACKRAVPDSAALHLLDAEVWLAEGSSAKATAAYRRALPLSDQPPAVTDAEAVQRAWKQAQNKQLVCRRCGKSVAAPAQVCPLCEAPLKKCDLFLEGFQVNGAAEAFVAHAGLAYLLADQGVPAEALQHLENALSKRPSGSGGEEVNVRLRQKKIELESLVASAPASGQPLAPLADENPFTPEALAHIGYICDTNPTLWHDLPLKTRLKLGRRLIEDDYLELAQAFMGVAFADKTGLKSVGDLAARLTQAVHARLAALLADARQRLDANDFEQALNLAKAGLALSPADDHARLICGEARLGIGHDLAALADFHTIITSSADPALTRAARLASARGMARRRDIDNALAIIRGLSGEDVEQIQARLERLKHTEPAVLISPADSEVMYDTLARTPATSLFHGYFAVVVRSVGRPWTVTLHDWMGSVLKGMFEFVQILGGLRHVVGTPIFALRLISQPHPHIPERGQLTLALLARISAESHDTCQRRALDLWGSVRGLLPAQHNYVYHFEQVIDPEELADLLLPFEPQGIAEIVRRETASSHNGDQHYTVYPFVPGTPDLINLCWMLLRQPASAMMSIHLLPTELMAWERTTFDRIMQEESGLEVGRVQDADGLRLADSVSQWWRGIPRWSQAHANRRLVDSMPSQAYLLAVNIASSAMTDALLPETVGSALFGPSNPAVDARYGGYEVVRASSASEFDIARSNLAGLDIERWVYTTAPDRLNRLRYLMSESEAVCAFRLPVPGMDGLPGVPLLDARPVPPPAGLPADGIVLGESVTSVAGMPLRITQGIEDRRRHTYILGKTGVGKTTLLQTMALQDIEAGHGVCVVDPHGDLIDEMLLRIPAHRINDVILFDPSDDERPVGLNLLEAASESEKSQIVNEFIGLLVRMYDPHNQGIVGPRFQHNVRNAMLTVMSVPGSTLIEVVRALTDSSFVRSVLPMVKDPLVRTYWEKQIANTSDYHKSEILDYIVSKFSRFVGDTRVRHIVGQRQTTLNFRQIMDRQHILLVNLSKGKIGSENAQFLGLLLVQQLLITALGRARVPTSERPDFFLYVDEFQNFATGLFATMLSEGRKYGVSVVVANQYLTQLDHGIREAIFGNAGSMISFRLGTQDASVMAPEMYPSFGADDLINLPKHTACVKLLVDGVAGKPFTMRTLPDLRFPDAQRAQAIRQASRLRYGCDITDIAGDIAVRFRG